MSSFRIRHVGYKPHRHPQNAIMCAAFTFLFAAFGSSATLLLVLPMDGYSVAALDPIAAWRALDMSHMSAPLYLHTGLAVLVATVAARCAFSLALAETPLEEPFRSVDDADPKLYYDEFARDDLSRRLTEEAGSNDKSGLWLAPHLSLPFSLDTKGIMIVGAPNSGKSNIVRALAEQAIQRNDRVLLHCNKGDVTQSFSNQNAILIAAHHRDSHAWDIAADVSDPAAAAEFAAAIIAKSENPFWSDTARLIATDVIVALIRERKYNWDARELLTRLIDDPQSMSQRIEKLDLSASPILKAGEENGLEKTVMSILSTLWSGAYSSLRPMAYAWTDFPPERRFSVKRWLSDDYEGPRTVIVQSSPEYSELSTMIAGGLIKRIATRLADPSLPSSPTRRMALILDELHMLGAIDRLDTALAVGREKGLVPIVALQSMSQLTKIYGRETAEVLSDLFQIKIYGRLTAGEAADVVERRLGKRLISALLDNRTPAKDDKRWFIEHKSTEPLFSATRLQRDLGVFKRADETEHVRALVHAYGNGYLLSWPLTRWAKIREGYVPAPWLNLMS